MRRHWLIGGLSLLCLAGIWGGFAWHQHRLAATATQPQATRTTQHDQATTNRAAAKPTTTTWHHLKHPLKLPILMYHSLSTGNQLRVPPAQFAREMAYLKRHHYRTLSAAEAVRALTTNSVPARHVVWITLDDAYRDNLTAGLPILQRDHLHATINVITGFTHKSNHLTLAQMTKMATTNRVDFASHTVQHLDLDELSTSQQRRELSASKTWLDTHLHQQTQVLCYPAGRANATTRRLARQAGYKVALTTNEGVAQLSQGRYNLARLRVTPGMSTATFATLLAVTNS
ncbi:polysaccharide deacetylase family protein [Levilactobacillus suantsaii]|uniref:Polysaccharide deacetylase family protein n=1 Tax=Levilactobacillus suantsaii TaxID=2292255 RepID=A0A4Q0VIM2_9LACO|nr:polysaccharide deacetylase family protein [Levilactobacillus suantsaii]RXI78207.1 polysaccharide deacetylase family protein [Levilactobacillus suantsaii]